MTGEIRSVEECIVELFDRLGIEQAHIAAGAAGARRLARRGHKDIPSESHR